MPLRKGLTNDWWHGMKTTICDFCGKVTPTDDPKAMLYDVAIFHADGYEAKTKEEKAVLFDTLDACMPCAKLVRKALVALQRELDTR